MSSYTGSKETETVKKTFDLSFKVILPYRSSYKKDNQFYNANPTTSSYILIIKPTR